MALDVSGAYSFYCGTVRGVLANSQCRKDKKQSYVIDKEHPAAEITCMKWGRNQDEIVIGTSDAYVKLFSIPENRYLSATNDYEGNGPIVGLHCDESRVFVARKSGHISLRNAETSDVLNINLDEKGSLDKMIYHNTRDNIIATGGEFNHFRLWNVETKKCVFQAKSLGHDELNLPIPTSIRDICFDSVDEKINFCCTKEGMVLVYDERKQKRPVMKFTEPKASYTVISPTFRDKQILVGTTKGYMQMLDLKMPVKLVKTFKSFTGAITGITVDSNQPLVATTSLDRFLRVHNLDTKELLHKEYLKQSLKCILMKPIIKEEKIEPVEKTEDEIIDEEYEELFNNMETITEKVKPLRADKKQKKQQEGSKPAKKLKVK